MSPILITRFLGNESKNNLEKTSASSSKNTATKQEKRQESGDESGASVLNLHLEVSTLPSLAITCLVKVGK